MSSGEVPAQEASTVIPKAHAQPSASSAAPVPSLSAPHVPPEANAAVPSRPQQVLATARTTAVSSGPLTKRVFKVIVIGDPNVGKTCLTFRFCNGRFPEQTEATIGVDFREKVVNLDGEMIRVQLWDTAGQERFRQSMTAHYYRNVQAVVFVYDVTKTSTFNNLTHWITECRQHSVNFTQTPAILIGNKCDAVVPSATDSPSSRVPTDVAQKFADSQNMPLFETSAKADSEADHVEAIFMTVVHRLKEAKSMALSQQEELSDSDGTIRPGLEDEQQGEGWCGC